MPLGAGDALGPYKILDQIGRGGMAMVYKECRESLDHDAAIEVDHPAFLEKLDTLD